MAITLPALPARLIHADADAFVLRCEEALRAAGPSAGQTVEVDASALQSFDSSVLAALLAVRRQTVSAGAELRVLGLPERLRGLSVLYGVSELLPA